MDGDQEEVEFILPERVFQIRVFRVNLRLNYEQEDIHRSGWLGL